MSAELAHSVSPDNTSPKNAEGLQCHFLADHGVEKVSNNVDLEAWRTDLQRLHGTIDQVVQSFISHQTRQLDAVAAELASQKERIALKESRFSELSDSIAGFVEEEAKRLEVWGVHIDVPEADARHEAYDAELPGPPTLHRINRLWRKALRAFDAIREAKEKEAAASLEQQRQQFERSALEAEQKYGLLQQERERDVASLEDRLKALQDAAEQKDGNAKALSGEAQDLKMKLDAAMGDIKNMSEKLQHTETEKHRGEYEWGAEREELTRQRAAAEQQIANLDKELAEAKQREEELTHKCADRAQKLEQMRRLMDDQERELNQKIDRVQHYVKERQAGALHAEKKQQDAEKMAERWQGEVRRLQAEKDRLSKVVLDLEGHQSGQTKDIHAIQERHRQEVASLQEALSRKDHEMRIANTELLQKRDDEYQAKVSIERQREKDRSIALLKKKEQEVQIKEQQLKAARLRIQELEENVSGGASGRSSGVHSASPPCNRSPSTSMSRSTLPPLPLSAR